MHALTDRLVTFGLGEWTQSVTLDDDDAVSLCAAAPHHGLVALLGAAVEHGCVHVSDTARTAVRHEWAERMAWCVQLDSVLVAVHGRLAACGIPVRVLKGSAVATLDEPDPSWRSYGDVDVLVPPDRLLDAMDALAGIGWHPAVAPTRRWWAARHAKGVTLVDGSGVQVDLHRLLATGPLGRRVSLSRLFDDGQHFHVGGVLVTALSLRDRFLHACYHAVLGGTFGPRQVRDVLLLATQLTPDSLSAVERDGWSPTVVAVALDRAAASGAVPSAWLQWANTVQRDPTDQASIGAANASFGAAARADARALARWTSRLGYLAGLGWPSRAHLASRHLTRLGHLRSLLRRRPRSRTT